MADADSFYIVKRPPGTCEIVSSPPPPSTETDPQVIQVWGPFSTQDEAIARRVGLIRAGKCQPV